MIMIVAIAVTMTTTIIEVMLHVSENCHLANLLIVLCHERDSVDCETHDAMRITEAFERFWCELLGALKLVLMRVRCEVVRSCSPSVPSDTKRDCT
jgi:hypothetical protein